MKLRIALAEEGDDLEDLSFFLENDCMRFYFRTRDNNRFQRDVC